MSKTIEILVELIEEEIEGAMHYAELANHFKADKPELARDLAMRAEEELKHAMSWHEWAVKEIDRKKADMQAKGEVIPPKMLVYWEIKHEEYIKEVNDVKRELAVYKGM